MTSPPGGGNGNQPPRRDPADEPLLPPSSDAGWTDESPPRPAPASAAPGSEPAPARRAHASSFPAYVPPAAASSSPHTASPPTTAPAAASAPPAPPSTTAPASPGGDEPLLPAAYDENDLRSAVGASPLADSSSKSRKQRAASSDGDGDGDDDDVLRRSPRSRRAITVAALGVVAAMSIGAGVLLGRMNSENYQLACEAERAVPQQGRGFPPWGMHALGGEQWRPVKIAPETRCKPRQTDDVHELEALYLAMIVEQATALLTAREVTRLDEAEALLKQGLLLTRPPEHETDKLAAERSERRQEIERLLGDVTYWRASAKLRDAAAGLAEAVKQFDSAAEQHPRHMTDAAAWASHVRKLAQQLTAGPTGAPTAPAPATPAAAPGSPEHLNTPAGTELPVEPEARPEPFPAAPLDAGVPSGGVLL